MKSSLGKLGVVLIIIFFFVVGCQTPVKKDEYSKGADWKYFASTENFLVYYDTQTITRLSENIVRVWLRWNWTEKGKLDRVKDFGKIMENLSHSKLLIEMDYVEKKDRRLSWIDYDNKGKMIDSFSSSSEWDFVTLETVGESLYKAVCK